MKVWIALENDYEETIIKKVFSSKEKAEEWANLFDYEVVEYDVAGNEVMEEGFYYRVDSTIEYDFIRHERTKWRRIITKVSYKEFLDHREDKKCCRVEASSFERVKIAFKVYVALTNPINENEYFEWENDDVATELYRLYCEDAQKLMTQLPMEINSAWDVMFGEDES